MVARADLSTIYIWCSVLIAAVLVGLAAVYWVRKRLMDEPDQSASVGLTLNDLRQLRSDGKITEEEYERARARIAAGMKQQAPPKRERENAG